MPIQMKATGVDELLTKMDALGTRAGEVAAKALYAGAGVMAGAFAIAPKQIRAEPFHYAWGGNKRLPSYEEKNALVATAGIAKFEGGTTEIDTAVGVGPSGYVVIAGKRKAVRKIAYSINSGTDFMEKQPIFRKAYTSTRAAATKAIVDTAHNLIDEITKK